MELIIIGIIVSLAVFSLGRHFYNSFHQSADNGNGGCSGCGCGCGCGGACGGNSRDSHKSNDETKPDDETSTPKPAEMSIAILN
ncbi:MAG: hypothetical protein J7L25_12090 [Deltaproteobacteria bacterium]|nr:hypothetical protein [Candidatus Tharpella aukensis]